MEKIDRLGWAAGTGFRAYGLRIGIRTNQAELPENLEESFPPGWKPLSRPVVDHLCSLRLADRNRTSRFRRYNLLYADSKRVARSLEPLDVIEALGTHLQLIVAAGARNRLFVHAGVVEWNGGALLFPGKSFSGKSSLVAALVRAGARYYSDEFAVLDSRGRVHPYPRPLSLRAPDGDTQTSRTAEELGGQAGTKPLPVSHVVQCEYRKGADWRPSVSSPAHGILVLLAHAVSARLQPKFAMSTLKEAVKEATFLRGTRGEAEEAAMSLLHELEQPA